MALSKVGLVDVNGTELILDADADTSITVDTDDRIDFKAGGSDIATINASGLGLGTTSPSAQLHIQGSDITDQVLIENTNSGAETAPDLTLFRNSSSPADSDTLANIIFRGKNDANEDINYFEMTGVIADASDGSEDTQVEFATKSAGSNATVMTFKSSNVGIGTSSPTFNNGTGLHLNSSTTDCRFHITNSSTGSTASDGAYIVSGGTGDMLLINQENANMLFYTNGSEYFRLENTGYFIYGGTDNLVYPDSSGNGGIVFRDNYMQSARQGANLYTNRIDSDGDIIVFHQDGNEEGNIRVSGTTISYNGFTGTHWTRLSDNSKPTILKGTILESLDEMMDWYQVQFNVTKTDDEGNETTTTKKQSYALGDGESVGDTITYTYEGTDYQATIIKEGDVKHSKCKVSDTSESKAVYGVFMDWDDEDEDTVNDMHVAQTGTFVVRLNSSVTTLNKGDLIQSNGDGTGKVQADDIIRASTVAKVLSTTKIETYSDGSYIVPCSLHC